MDLGYLIAGGALQFGDAYSQNQKDQRKFKLDQKTEDANLLRKQNFARFGVKIDQQKAQNRSDVALAEYGSKKKMDDDLSMSGRVDPSTGRELTKKELAEHSDPSKLVGKADYESDAKTKREIKSEGQKYDARKERVKKEYADEPGKAKAAIDALNKLSVSERKPGGMSEKDKQSYKTKMQSAITKQAKEMDLEEKLTPVNKAIAGISLWDSADESQREVLKTLPDVRRGMAMSSIAQSMLSQREQGTSMADAKKMFMKGGKYSEKDWKQLLEFMEKQGDLIPQGGGLGSLRPGKYKGDW